MAGRNSGGKLMMAGVIVAFIGLCIVLVQILHVPRVLDSPDGRRRDLPRGTRAMAHRARFVTAPP